MGADPILITATPPALAPGRRHSTALRSVLAEYWALTKPEVNLLIIIATFAGFYLGLPSHLAEFPSMRLVNTLFGTLLVASGSGSLNQYVERRFDAQMRRTARRPLAAGRLKPHSAVWFGTVLSALGSIYLALVVDVLASFLTIITLVSYLFLYTPLKRKTPLCTIVGAFPGAMPPLIGWAAASEGLSLEASIRYAELFLWQFPHFMAIPWMYREDYCRAGYIVLPTGHSKGRFAAWLTLVPLLGLIPVSLMPVFLSGASLRYQIGALLAGLVFLFFGTQLARRKSNSDARRLLLASVIYLPLVFVLLMTDNRW